MSCGDLQHVFVLDPEFSGEAVRYRPLFDAFSIQCCSTFEKLLSEIKSTSDHFVVIISYPLMKEARVELKKELLGTMDHRRIGLLADVPLEDFLDDLNQWHLLHVVPHTQLSNEAIGKNFIRCLHDPSQGFGLAQYFNETPSLKERLVVNLKEKKNLIEEILTEFHHAGHGHELLYDIRLVLEEAMNNAFYHAYKGEDGIDKYSVQNFSEFSSGEEIRVLFGGNHECAGFAISDQAGSLTLQTIFRKLKRQFSGEGIFDENGRGLFLTRLLTSQLIVNLDPGKRTQMVALFTRNRQLDSIKPFRINYLQTMEYSDSSLDPELD
jgi:anti-sigma regulatory factor (Ser/Thr protein kinase)